MGGDQREIDAQGIAADKEEFETQRDFDYNQVKWMSSLLDGLPIAAQSYAYEQPSGLNSLMGSVEGAKTIWDLLGIGGGGEGGGGTASTASTLGGDGSGTWSLANQQAFQPLTDVYLASGLSQQAAAEAALADLGFTI